jgi:hypothetical protein
MLLLLLVERVLESIVIVGRESAIVTIGRESARECLNTLKNIIVVKCYC